MKYFIYAMMIFTFYGCSVQKQVVGEFYLEQKQYEKGYDHFKKNIEEDVKNASSQYYLGRFLLAKGKTKEATVHLKKAVLLDKSNPKYHSWLGVSYSLNKDYKKERKEYLKALGFDKNHLQSLIYLAHNYYDKKEYTKALEYYFRVLDISDENQTVLYHRAMAFQKLGRKAEEIIAFKEYLAYYPSGSFAKESVKSLNKLGNFEYRNFVIGIRSVTLKNINFKPFTANIDYESKKSLDVLGKILTQNRDVEIHIVAYQEKNLELAKKRVKSIKKYLLDKYSKIESNRLKLSWFDSSKKINRYKLYESIEFITVVK
jgi:tetratricopeptide (TPR) repeat protein